MNQKVNEMKESDFREVRDIVEGRTGKSYTAEYVRKVYKGLRKNTAISQTIVDYQEMLADMKARLIEVC